jgi:hypothetical protein
MRLLVFRCEDLYSLISFNGIDDSTVGYRLRLAGNDEDEARALHSIWLQLRTYYAFFGNCDCIFIQSPQKVTTLNLEWWKVSTRRIMELGKQFSGLRFFVVGNVDGYVGVEGAMETSRCEDLGSGHSYWNWKFLGDGRCRALLRERMYRT